MIHGLNSLLSKYAVHLGFLVLIFCLAGTNGVPTDGAESESSLRGAKKLLSEVVKGREGGRYCCVLLELGLCLLLDGAQGKSALTAMSGSSQSILGQHLLCDLFRWQPHVRAELISTVFNALVEHVHSPRYIAPAPCPCEECICMMYLQIYHDISIMIYHDISCMNVSA